MVKLCSFNLPRRMVITMFQEKSNTHHIPEPIIRRFSPELVPVLSLRSSSIDSFSFANSLQGFGAFFVHLVMCSILVTFSSLLLPFFLILLQLQVEFLIKQLFYSGLLDIRAPRWLSIIRYPARPHSNNC